MTQTEDHITVYSDYVCPFCYLGRRSLETYQETRERDLAIEWHPFDLRSHRRGPDGEIDHSIEDGKDEAYFEQARENVRRLQSQYGAEEMLDPSDVPDDIDSFNAQVASYYVKETYPEQWLAFDEAIFEALWVAGRDIGDVGVLTDIATSVGLDPTKISDSIDDETLREEVREEFTAAQREGVTGVPTFAYDGYAARGAVPPEQLQRLVEDN